MENNNIYNFNQYGKNYLDRAKRLQKQTAEYLEESAKSAKAAEAAKLEKENNAALSSARFAYGSSYARQKERTKDLQETVQYNEKASLAGMTEMVTEVVKRALLLDEEEYAKLNENYENDIRETVYNFLSKGNINETINNKDTLNIMEYVQSVLPDVKTGKYLSEAQIAGIVKSQTPSEVEESIDNLAGDVSSRVAKLTKEEADEAKKVNDEVKKSAKKEEKVEEEVEAPVEEAPVEGEEVEYSPANEEEVDVKKQVQLLPDGTMNINIFEALEAEINDYKDFDESLLEAFDSNRELEKNAIKTVADDDPHASGWGVFWGWFFGGIIGIILAVLCKFGRKGYAKKHQKGAIMALIKMCKEDPECQELISKMNKAADEKDKKTLKALRKEFSMRVNEIKYEKRYNDTEHSELRLKLAESFVRETPRKGLIESLAVNEATEMLKEGKEYNPDLVLANAIMYVTITEAMDQLGLMNIGKEEYSEIITRAGGNISEGKTPKAMCNVNRNKIEKCKAYLSESVLVSQHVDPLQNGSYGDIAERLRQKRLQEEQGTILD